MEKNERYSRVNYPALRELRKVYKKQGEKFLKYYANKVFELAENKTLDHIGVNEAYLIIDTLRLKYENYFIKNSELSDFFSNTQVKDEILENIIEICKENYTGKVTSEMNFDIPTDCVKMNGCIHTKSFERSLFFNISYYYNFKKPADFGDKYATLTVTDGDDVMFIPMLSSKSERSNLYANDVQGRMLRLVLNMIFYMSAFPENVLNSPPDEECDKLNKNNSKTISISPTISEYLHENRDVQPHLRRGHFRFLGSDHFTKKRGQTIFVKASFVKGEAKTVI